MVRCLSRAETSNFATNEAPSVLLSDSGASETSAITGAKIARLSGDCFLVNKVYHGSLLSSVPCKTFRLSLNGIYMCVARDVLTLHPVHMRQEGFVQHNQLCLESQRPSSQKQTAAQTALYQREVN